MFQLTDKLDLRRGGQNVALSNLNIYYTWKNIKSLYNNKKFKISAPTWNDKFELPDGSYSVSDIQHYLSIKRYVNKIENRITFKIKTGYTSSF